MYNILNNLPRGLVLGYPILAGDEGLPTFTHQPTYTYHTHDFYHNLEQHKWMEERRNQSLRFFMSGNQSFLKENNISYIFIPAEITGDEHYTTELLKKYSLIARSGGAKLLVQEKTSQPIIHLELENFVKDKYSLATKTYSYGGIISFKTVKLNNNESLSINIDIPDDVRLIFSKAKKIKIYVKHLTFLEPLSFDIWVGTQKYTLSKVSDKLTFSESFIEVPLDEILTKQVQLVGRGAGIGVLKLRTYAPEIDWIEITPSD